MKRKHEDTLFSERADKIYKSNSDVDVDIDIKAFNPSDFYRVEVDVLLNNTNAVVPFYAGSLLIAQYYTETRGANILFLKSQTTSESCEKGFYQCPDIYLSEARKKTHTRQAFLLGMDTLHTTPVIYFKKNEEECLLIADSLGASFFQKEVAMGLHKKINIPIYIIESARQSDTYSCYTDALLMGIKSTSINDETQEYEITDLPDFLKNNAVPLSEGVFSTKLPDALLTTCQIPNFLVFHKENNNPKPIHKNETLVAFRDRFTVNMTINMINPDSESFEKKSKNIYIYPMKKSFKFADIMQIQFYLNQIHACGKNLSSDERREFIQHAKQILTPKNDFESKTQALIKLTRDFIQNKSLSETILMGK